MNYRDGVLSIALIFTGCEQEQDRIQAPAPSTVINAASHLVTNVQPATNFQQALRPDANGRYPVRILEVPDDRTNGMPGAVAAMSQGKGKPPNIRPPLPKKTDSLKLSTSNVHLFRDGFVIKQIETTRSDQLLVVAQYHHTAPTDETPRRGVWLRVAEFGGDLKVARQQEFRDRSLAGAMAGETDGGRFVLATMNHKRSTPPHLEIGRLDAGLQLSQILSFPSVRGQFGIEALTGDSNGTFSAVGWIKSLSDTSSFVSDRKPGRYRFKIHRDPEQNMSGPSLCEDWPAWRVGEFDGPTSLVIEAYKQKLKPLLYAEGDERITTTGLSRINLNGNEVRKRDLADLNMSKLWVTRPYGDSLLMGGDLNGEMVGNHAVRAADGSVKGLQQLLKNSPYAGSFVGLFDSEWRIKWLHEIDSPKIRVVDARRMANGNTAVLLRSWQRTLPRFGTSQTWEKRWHQGGIQPLFVMLLDADGNELAHHHVFGATRSGNHGIYDAYLAVTRESIYVGVASEFGYRYRDPESGESISPKRISSMLMQLEMAKTGGDAQ